MIKAITFLLCLLVAVPAWPCAILNAGDHSELGGECTQSDLNALLNAYNKQLGSSDSMPQPLEMNYKLIPEPMKPKPKFFKVIDEDIRIRRDKITGWKIERGLVEDTTKEKRCGEIGQIGSNVIQCNYPPRVVYEVWAEYLNQWYTLYVGKTKQDAINWLDRNGP